MLLMKVESKPGQTGNRKAKCSQLYHKGKFQHISVSAQWQLWQCNQNFRGAVLSCTVKAIVECNISLGTETGVKGAVKAN